jgi:hypothetical protein
MYHVSIIWINQFPPVIPFCIRLDTGKIKDGWLIYKEGKEYPVRQIQDV